MGNCAYATKTMEHEDVQPDVHPDVCEDVNVIVPTDVQSYVSEEEEEEEEESDDEEEDEEEDDDMEGATPMHLAAKNGHADVVKSLMLQGANPSAKNANGCTPLHLAAKYGHANVIMALLDFGRDENQTTVTEHEPATETNPETTEVQECDM